MSLHVIMKYEGDLSMLLEGEQCAEFTKADLLTVGCSSGTGVFYALSNMSSFRW